jgi:hypothetical protein
MRVHGSVPGVRVEAKVDLGLEQRRWMAGRTGELGAAATAGAKGRHAAAPEQCEGGGVAWGVGRSLMRACKPGGVGRLGSGVGAQCVAVATACAQRRRAGRRAQGCGPGR